MSIREYEDKFLKEGGKYIVGIDEAGRGPLAGPLVVAAVILPPGYNNEKIYDSKELTDNQRREAYEEIKKDALEIKTVIIEPKIIDKLNIFQATKKGMEDVLKMIDLYYDAVFVDALKLDGVNKPQLSLIKGDKLSISIAAASIVAKVIRDDIMLELDKLYPLYDFKNNKGYPTRKHLLILDEIGITKEHRKSYAPVKKAMQTKLDI